MPKFSRQTKSTVQLSVELNDELTNLIQTFVTNYNRIAYNVNDIIQNVSNNEEMSDVLPFIGSTKKLMSVDELNKLSTDDYHLVSKNEINNVTKDVATITDYIKNMTEQVNTVSLTDQKDISEDADYELV